MTSYIRYAGCFVTAIHILDSKIRSLSQNDNRKRNDIKKTRHLRTIFTELSSLLVQPMKRIVIYPILIGEVFITDGILAIYAPINLMIFLMHAFENRRNYLYCITIENFISNV